MLLHVIYCMSVRLIWFQNDWSKLCSTNSFCNMSKAGNYLQAILFSWIIKRQQCAFLNTDIIVTQIASVATLRSYTLILPNIIIRLPLNGASGFFPFVFVMGCHVLVDLVTETVIVLIELQSVNQRHSLAGYQRHQNKCWHFPHFINLSKNSGSKCFNISLAFWKWIKWNI